MNRIAALLSILALLPVGLVISIANFFIFGKIFFLQPRIGINGNEFNIVKFRSMRSPGVLTRWGTFIRNFHLDELPQLINVLKGEMAFIGPRPLLTEYRQDYSPKQWKRHAVLPGITGLAQVLGGKNMSWERQFQLDLFYIQKKSICLDFFILIRTIKTLFTFDKNAVEESRKWTKKSHN